MKFKIQLSTLQQICDDKDKRIQELEESLLMSKEKVKWLQTEKATNQELSAYKKVLYIKTMAVHWSM